MPVSLRSTEAVCLDWTHALPYLVVCQLGAPFAPGRIPRLSRYSWLLRLSLSASFPAALCRALLPLTFSGALGLSSMAGEGGGFELFRLGGAEVNLRPLGQLEAAIFELGELLAGRLLRAGVVAPCDGCPRLNSNCIGVPRKPRGCGTAAWLPPVAEC